MDELQWGDPPRRDGRRSYHRHELVAKRLKARQGEWAWLVFNSARGASNAASTAALGGIPAYEPAGDFEAVHRLVDGEHRMYVRYLGDGADE